MAEETVPARAANRFDRMEVAGAFGDLGTLIPFVVAYIGVLKMDPFGVLLAFGLAMIVCGFVYRTPIPVQPMKAAGAIATTQAAQTLIITPAMVWGASLATGIIWLILGLTGTARHVAKLITRPVVLGIILGLGFGFMIEGAKMMSQNWWIGGGALLGTALLLTNRVVPAMFLLLVFGAGYGIVSDPTLLDALGAIQMEVRLPAFSLIAITLNDFILGAVFLALPQIPLTLGNAVIAITEENNRLFPNRPVNESKIATSTGLMNMLSASVGGVPDVSRRRRHGRARPVRRAHGRGAGDPGCRASGHGPVVQRLRRHALAPVSSERSGRDPVPDRSAAGAWRLRRSQRQGRTLRDDDHRRPCRLERGHRVRCRRRGLCPEQARLASDLKLLRGTAVTASRRT